MESQKLNRLQLTALLFGVFVTSFGVLSFEISLTRIFSIMLDYHYTFLVVSLALFGIGLGGIIAQRYSSKTPSKENFGKLAILAIVFSLSTAFLTLFAVALPNLNMALQVSIMFLPFLIAGTLLAMIYKVYVTHSNTLHFADLVGAALGSLSVIFLINWTGAPQTVLLIGLVTLISSIFFSLASKKKLVMVVALLTIVGMGAFAQFSSGSGIWDIQPASDQGKELQSYLSGVEGSKITQTLWTSFGQVELVTSPSSPHEKVIFVDGGAGTRLYHFNGDFNSNNTLVPALRNSTMYFPYYFANKGSSLVIGPGGGVDVLTALMGGVNHIYAVDVNPGIVDMVREQSAYDGGIYSDYNNVHVTVDDGRSYIKTSNQKYDVIMLDIPISKTSQGTFGYALAENYLFTTDSFNDYLNHLNDGGFLAIVAHGQAEIYKLVSIAFDVLGSQRLGARQIMDRIAVVGSEHMMNMNSLPVFILAKSPITQAQAMFISSTASEKGFENLYSPLTLYNPNDNGASTDPHLAHIATNEMTINQLISIAPFNLNAPTDDSPFFYNFDLGVPSMLSPLLAGAIVLCIAVSVLYAFARRREEVTFNNGMRVKLKSKFSAFKWYCFASLGFGFMLIEVAFIQKFILFLGEPTLAIAASLFSLLLAGGLGSLLSRKWVNGKQYNAFVVSLIVAVLAITYIFALPVIFNITLSYSASLRFLVSFVLISPIGFLMSIPFPTILGYIKQEFENDAAWMWCINGAFSVLAGVLGLVVAMIYGFDAVLLLGALTYVGVFLVGRMHEQNKVGKVKWINPRKPQFKKR